MANDVVRGATTDAGDIRYALVDLNEQTISILARHSPPTFLKAFGDYRASPAPVIGVGDSVRVTVWEAAAGGLFSAPSIGGVTAGSHSAVIPDQVVARDGSITVPYAGRVRVVGLAPPQVEQAIIRQLTGKAIEPQALVTVTSAVSNSATVTGEVTQGGRVPLTTRGDRILDVIAVAGGVRAPVHETFITLHRNGRAATVPMQTLLQNPRENINVRPADVLTLVRTPQTFSVFGATGRNAVVPFDAVGLSVEEAVAKSGGLIGLEADPEGVLLLRREPAKLVRALAPQHPIGAGEELVNVVYRINLRDANTYFLARRMAVFNKDMLYVAPAMAVEARKLLELFNVGASTLSNAAITRLYLRQ